MKSLTLVVSLLMADVSRAQPAPVASCQGQGAIQTGQIDTGKISCQARAQLVDEVRALSAKIKAKTSTQDEERRVILILLRLLGLD